MIGKSVLTWAFHRFRLAEPCTQLTREEQLCLTRHAAGRRSLVEIGVMHGASTALMRKVMDPDGTLTGIDPHPPGRLGVSFERFIAEKEVQRQPGGRVEFLRMRSTDAVAIWTRPIDCLFVDGDHSWSGIDCDWRGFSPFVVPGGVVLLHDSRSVPEREDADSVRYTDAVVRKDLRFRLIEGVDSMTVFERRSTPE